MRAYTMSWDLSACDDCKGAFPCQARTSQIGLHAPPVSGQGRAEMDHSPIRTSFPAAVSPVRRREHKAVRYLERRPLVPTPLDASTVSEQ